MKTVYEASHATEAHMLVDLLKQQGIGAHILGEHLQGAIGELPAAGLVRVVVEDEDVDAARAVIADWEGANPAPPTPAPPPARSRGLRWFALGLGAGMVLMYAGVRAPVRQDGIDYNRDGVLDETWSFSATGRAVRTDTDRNLDGKVDLIARHDLRGLIESAESDDDFDGRFETKHRYGMTSVEASESDSDADGYPDVRVNSRHGVVATVEYVQPTSGLPLRVEHYRLGRLVHADLDTDRDGRLETRLVFDAALEIASRAPIAP